MSSLYLFELMSVLMPASLLAYWRWRRAAAAALALREPEILWDFSINEDLCIGCDKCVQICPEEVLKLNPHTQVAQVVAKPNCVQCRACDKTCPTGALKMYRVGDAAPTIDVPDLDKHYQPAGLPGLYLIGELAGKPRIKNAINLGRAAIEHITLSGILPQPVATAPSQGVPRSVDVIIVGAGPGGLSAAIACTQARLSYLLLEQADTPLHTIVRYPKGKTVHALPHELQCHSPLAFAGGSKEALVQQWQEVKANFRIREQTNVAVQDIKKVATGFQVTTDRLGTLQAQRVVLAIGGTGRPRPLPDVPAAQQAQPHVLRSLPDPDQIRQRCVAVVGGSDSAVEAALALSKESLQNTVYLIYHKDKSFISANKENTTKLKDAIQRRQIFILDSAKIKTIEKQSITIERKNKSRTIEIHFTYAMIGIQPNKEFLHKIGIRNTRYQHIEFSRGPTDELLQELLAEQNRRRPQPRAEASTLVSREQHLPGVGLRVWQTAKDAAANEPSWAQPTDHTQVDDNLPTTRLFMPGVFARPLTPHQSPPAWTPGPSKAAPSAMTERLSMAQIAAQLDAPPTPGEVTQIEQPPTLRGPIDLHMDPAIYKTIRIPNDQQLMRMPARASVSDNLRRRADIELANQTTLLQIHKIST